MALTDALLLGLLQHLEVELHRSDIRSNPEKLDLLLHPDFKEFGRLGATYTKRDVMKRLAHSSQSSKASSSGVKQLYEADSFELRRLGPDSALVTYRTSETAAGTKSKHITNRSSIWVKTGVHWQMMFHQGTPTWEVSA